MPPIQVIYEDHDFAVVNKPAGILAHGVGGKEQETLADWVVGNYPEARGVGDDPDTRPGIVHRLDRETSGVMVVAKNQKSFDYLKSLFQKSQIKKTYKALVFGFVKPESGTIDKPIGLVSGTTRHTVRVQGAKLVKPARTGYRVIGQYAFEREKFSFVELRPETGRTHQLRVHLASIGHPVVGDSLYVRSAERRRIAERLGLKRQALHAESIEFTAPAGGRVSVSADLSDDLAQALRLLSPAP